MNADLTGTTGLIRREIELYRDFSNVWQRDHQQAMACYNFQDLLSRGLAVFEMINRIDEEYRRDVFAGRRECSSEFDQQVRELYQSWLEPCQGVLATLEHFERAGFKVDFAGEFRAACREAAGILANPSEFFSDDALVKLRDDAIDANRRGDVSELI